MRPPEEARRMNKLLAVLLLIVLAPVAIAACGGSDAPSKDEYIAQADEICQKGDDDLDAAIENEFGTRSPSQQEIIQFSEDEVIPNIEEQLVALRELTPPDGEEETVNEIYDTLGRGLEEYKADPDLQNPPEAVQEANRLAEEYGLEVCGRTRSVR
jgi:hypothetical protein